MTSLVSVFGECSTWNIRGFIFAIQKCFLDFEKKLLHVFWKHVYFPKVMRPSLKMGKKGLLTDRQAAVKLGISYELLKAWEGLKLIAPTEIDGNTTYYAKRFVGQAKKALMQSGLVPHGDEVNCHAMVDYLQAHIRRFATIYETAMKDAQKKGALPDAKIKEADVGFKHWVVSTMTLLEAMKGNKVNAFCNKILNAGLEAMIAESNRQLSLANPIAENPFQATCE